MYARWLDPGPHWLPGKWKRNAKEEEIIQFPKIASFFQVAYGRILRALSLSGAWKVHVKLDYNLLNQIFWITVICHSSQYLNVEIEHARDPQV